MIFLHYPFAVQLAVLRVVWTVLSVAGYVGAIQRPKNSDWYRRVLGNIRSMARQLGVSDDQIIFEIGQSHGHQGMANNYQLRHGNITRCFTGSHRPDKAVNFHPGNLRGPFHRDWVVEWQEACPDYNAPGRYRPAA